jgi:signal peptidase I
MDTKETEEQSKKESPWELVRFVLFALLIMVPIRLFVVQPFVVSGSSMFPTFQDGNYLIVDEISYRLGTPERYDVVIFRYPNDTKKFFIKRIIGLLKLAQPYVKNESKDDGHFELKENEYFVMGDNRDASSDSRYWGALPRDLMVGRALVRLWPIKNLDMWPGKYTETKQAE